MQNSRRSPSVISIAMIARVGMLASMVASGGVVSSGQTVTWNPASSAGGPSDGAGTWNAANSNWWNGSANQAWSAGNTAVFGAGGTPGTVTVSGSQNAGGITFGPYSGSTGYTLSGGTIGLTSGASILLSGSSGIDSRLVAANLSVSRRAGETTATALTLAGSNALAGSLTINADATLNVGANSAIGGTSAVPITVNAGGKIAFLNTVNGAFNNQFSGAGTLVKRTMTTVTLGGTTSSFGGTTLDAGQLVVSPTSTSTFALGVLSRTVGSGLSLRPGSGTITVDPATPLVNGLIGPWATFGTGTNLAYATHSAGTVVAAAPTIVAATAASLPNNPAANVELQAGTGTIPATVSANTIRAIGTGDIALSSSGSFVVNGIMNARAVELRFNTNGAFITIASSELVLATGAGNFTLNGPGIRETTPNSRITIISQGGGVLLGGTVGYTGDINFSSTAASPSLTFNLPASSSSTWQGDINLPANGTVTFNSNSGAIGQVNGTIRGDSANLSRGSGSVGTLRLLGTHLYSGSTALGIGTTEIGSLPSIGTAGSLGNPTAATGTIALGTTDKAATLKYVGSGNSTTDRAINLAGTTGTVSLDASGAGSLAFTSGFAASGAGSKLLTLTGSSLAANTIGGGIPDNTSTHKTSVTKTGVGRWILSGTSGFSGNFSLDNGTLVAGANAPASGNGVLGSTTQVVAPTIGSTTVTTGTAALLLAAGVTIDRRLVITAPSGSQGVVLGGNATSGTATFGGSAGSIIQVGRPLVLAAAGSNANRGTVRFANGWSGPGGSGSPASAFTIGSPGNEGIVSLGNDLTTSGSVSVQYGSLIVESGRSLQPGTGPLQLDAGVDLTGAGTIASSITGGGRIGPGNSPGILTATSITPGNLIFDFEFTAAGAPNYADPSSSINDVLRLTGATPFASALTASNVVNIYFDMATVGSGTFVGGFFTDQTADFASLISAASFNYFVRDAGGATTYNGTNYSPFTSGIILSTVSSGPSFDGGAVVGRVAQLVIVPEPGSLALGVAGLSVAAVGLWRRAARGRRMR